MFHFIKFESIEFTNFANSLNAFYVSLQSNFRCHPSILPSTSNICRKCLTHKWNWTRKETHTQTKQSSIVSFYLKSHYVMGDSNFQWISNNNSNHMLLFFLFSKLCKSRVTWYTCIFECTMFGVETETTTTNEQQKTHTLFNCSTWQLQPTCDHAFSFRSTMKRWKYRLFYLKKNSENVYLRVAI